MIDVLIKYTALLKPLTTQYDKNEALTYIKSTLATEKELLYDQNEEYENQVKQQVRCVC